MVALPRGSRQVWWQTSERLHAGTRIEASSEHDPECLTLGLRPVTWCACKLYRQKRVRHLSTALTKALTAPFNVLRRMTLLWGGTSASIAVRGAAVAKHGVVSWLAGLLANHGRG